MFLIELAQFNRMVRKIQLSHFERESFSNICTDDDDDDDQDNDAFDVGYLNQSFWDSGMEHKLINTDIVNEDLLDSDWEENNAEYISDQLKCSKMITTV